MIPNLILVVELFLTNSNCFLLQDFWIQLLNIRAYISRSFDYKCYNFISKRMYKRRQQREADAKREGKKMKSKNERHNKRLQDNTHSLHPWSEVNWGLDRIIVNSVHKPAVPRLVRQLGFLPRHCFNHFQTIPCSLFI